MVLSRAGRRRDYVAIQSATATADGQGGYTTTWATVQSEWARAVVQSQSRVLEQGGIKYKTAVEVTIRKRTDYTLSTDHRIVWNSTNYTIHSVVPAELNEDLTVTAYA